MDRNVGGHRHGTETDAVLLQSVAMVVGTAKELVVLEVHRHPMAVQPLLKPAASFASTS